MINSNRRSLGPILLAVALVKLTSLHAQDIQLGGNAAFAGDVLVTPRADARGVREGKFASAGVELSAQFSDRFGLFAEYARWARLQSLQSTPGGLRGMDLGGGGVRIVAPSLPGGFLSFVDVGLAAGQYLLVQSPRENRVYGYLLGYGVIFPISDRWHVRPQARGHFMADKLCFNCPFLLGESRALIFLSWGLGVGVGL